MGTRGRPTALRNFVPTSISFGDRFRKPLGADAGYGAVLPSFKNEAFSFFTHAAGALAALAGLVLLVLRTDDRVAIAAFSIYGGTMIAMFTSSALHHVAHAEEGFFRKLDMSAIYLFIAGTYTPVSLLAVPPSWGIPMLAIVWVLAIAGVILRWTLPRTPRRVTAGIYLGLGWLGVVGIYPLLIGFGWTPVIYLALGGLVYTVGAIVYARKRPDPWPHYVGYHGLWHVFVLGGAGFHFLLIWLVSTP